MLNTDAESVDDIVAAIRNAVSIDTSICIPDIIARQKMNAPVSAVVRSSASVERMSPGASTGLISENLVSIPPVNRMMLRAIIPMNCAPEAEENCSPSPSLPNSIPVRRNSNRVGTPKRNPVLLIRIAMNIRTAPSNNIFSPVNTISSSFRIPGLIPPHLTKIRKFKFFHLSGKVFYLYFWPRTR